MSRLARIVVPGVPHYVAQRGNRDLEVFFGEADYQRYLADVAEACAKAGTAVWAYCLLPNRVHFILLPRSADGLPPPWPSRTAVTRDGSTAGRAGTAISGRSVSNPSRSTRAGSATSPATSSRVPCGPAWRAAPSPGPGRAPAPIWPAPTTAWSRSLRS